MKSTSFRSALFFFVFSFLLSSCSLLQKHEFAQRKYYDFPRAKHTVAKAEVERKAKAEANAGVSVERKAPIDIKKSEVPGAAIASVPKKQAEPSVKRKETRPSAAHTSLHALAAAGNEIEVAAPHKLDVVKLSGRQPVSSGDSDTMLILLVLLALFIPPLACFIKNNNRIDQWFWITLILCILSGSILGAGYFFGGGLWLVAAIIALLVVFEAL